MDLAVLYSFIFEIDHNLIFVRDFLRITQIMVDLLARRVLEVNNCQREQ